MPPMSAHRENPQNSGGSHVSAWITVMIAAPLIYLLTLPGVVAAAVPAGSITPGSRPSKWLISYLTPAVLLCKFEPFSEIYGSYCEWCWKTVLKRADLH
jgi:hypothetical protein